MELGDHRACDHSTFGAGEPAASQHKLTIIPGNAITNEGGFAVNDGCSVKKIYGVIIGYVSSSLHRTFNGNIIFMNLYDYFVSVRAGGLPKALLTDCSRQQAEFFDPARVPSRAKTKGNIFAIILLVSVMNSQALCKHHGYFVHSYYYVPY